MAKRKGRGDDGHGRGAGRSSAIIEDVALAEATRSRYLNYALSVITSRALPDVRDGLKPVQRRILYAMWHDLHVTADGRFIKCAAVVGEVMKTYHPHGDQSIYDALVRHGAAVPAAADADRGLRQFRLDRRRSARRDAVHRMPPDPDRPGAPERAAGADRRLPAELCLDRRGADRPARPVPQPPGQRGLGHRRRHGDQHPAPQSQGSLRRPARTPRRPRAAAREDPQAHPRPRLSRPAA